MSQPSSTGILDGTALGLSTLCLIHCLALPVLAVMLPTASVLSDQEWLHKVFVLLAVPITGLAALKNRSTPFALIFASVAGTGIGLLLAGAFLEQLHDYETLLTVTGATFVVIAHAMRWHHHHKTDQPEQHL